MSAEDVPRIRLAYNKSDNHLSIVKMFDVHGGVSPARDITLMDHHKIVIVISAADRNDKGIVKNKRYDMIKQTVSINVEGPAKNLKKYEKVNTAFKNVLWDILDPLEIS